MTQREIICYATVFCLGAAAIWFSMLSPEARECEARGGRYFAVEDACGVFEFRKR